MYSVGYTSQFKKDYKRAKKRNLPLEKLKKTVEMLARGEALPPSMKDYALTGDYRGYSECHLQPDWLLIYYIEGDVLVLTVTRTGSHSDLFR